MNSVEKLQLIRALEEREPFYRRMGLAVAWGSVLVAALVLHTAVRYGASEVEKKNTELVKTNRDLGQARQELQGGLPEAALDTLLEARPVQSGPAPSDRRAVVEKLFDKDPSVRIKAYDDLLPRYAKDPSLAAEVIQVAAKYPDNQNGIYNALVVLSHMNADRLKPHRSDIIAFARNSQREDRPRIKERANILLRRIPGSPQDGASLPPP